MRRLLFLLFVVSLSIVGCGVEDADVDLDKTKTVSQITIDGNTIDEEFHKDTKQVYEMLEMARVVNRMLNSDEKSLVGEYEIKYKEASLNEREKFIYILIQLLSTSTKDTHQLETNNGFYEGIKDDLLDYIDLN